MLISPRSLKGTQLRPISVSFTNPEGHDQKLPCTSYLKQLFLSRRWHEGGKKTPGLLLKKIFLYIARVRKVTVLCAFVKLAWTKHILSERGKCPALPWPTSRLIFMQISSPEPGELDKQCKFQNGPFWVLPISAGMLTKHLLGSLCVCFSSCSGHLVIYSQQSANTTFFLFMAPSIHF